MRVERITITEEAIYYDKQNNYVELEHSQEIIDDRGKKKKRKRNKKKQKK